MGTLGEKYGLGSLVERLYVVKKGLSELHSVFVFGMLVQGGFRAELGTALCASELSCAGGSTYTDRLHHGASSSDNSAQDCQSYAAELNCMVYVH